MTQFEKNYKKYLTGDITLPPRWRPIERRKCRRLFMRLAYAAKSMGEVWRVLSGYRSNAEQAVLYAAYLNGTGNLAAPPGSSNHNRGKAADVYDPRFRPIGTRKNRRAALRSAGLCLPVKGEPWHVERGDTWRA